MMYKLIISILFLIGMYFTATAQQYPSDVLPALTSWKLTLPVDANGKDNSHIKKLEDRLRKPMEIIGRDLIDYQYKPYFYAQNAEVYFRAHAAGVTTKNSKNPRSELRQLVGGGNNYWSVQDPQRMTVHLRVTHLPTYKQKVVISQIHGPVNEPLKVSYSPQYKGVIIEWNESHKDLAHPVPYQLGEHLIIDVKVNKGKITCTITNTDQDKTYSKTWRSEDSTGYFKVGCYTQANKYLSQYKKGFRDEPNDSYGEVAVSKIELETTYPTKH